MEYRIYELEKGFYGIKFSLLTRYLLLFYSAYTIILNLDNDRLVYCLKKEVEVSFTNFLCYFGVLQISILKQSAW